MHLSIETCFQFGIAFGMWAATQAKRGGISIDGPFDCVAAEESEPYAALCREIITQEGNPELPRSPVPELAIDGWTKPLYAALRSGMRAGVERVREGA